MRGTAIRVAEGETAVLVVVTAVVTSVVTSVVVVGASLPLVAVTAVMTSVVVEGGEEEAGECRRGCNTPSLPVTPLTMVAAPLHPSLAMVAAP